LHTLQPPSAAKSTKSMTEHRDGEVATAAESSEKKKSCCSPLHRNLIIAVIFVGIGIPVSLYNPFYAYVWFLGIPMICLLLQYLWLRLCRDPFLSQSDTLGAVTLESFSTCPPSLQRTVPTILFWIFVSLCVVGAILGNVIINGLEPDLFTAVTYNWFGSLCILTSAIWLVDALCLIYLFVVADKMLGHKGAAQDWWYRNKMVSIDKEEGHQSTVVASGDSERQNEEFKDPTDGEKSKQLDRRRAGAKMRLVLIVVLYGWWTVWSYFAAYDPEILEVNVPVPKLPEECDGYGQTRQRICMSNQWQVLQTIYEWWTT